MTAKLYTNWTYADLAEASSTPGRRPGDLVTTSDGYAYHENTSGSRFYHGDRRDFGTYSAGTNMLIGTVNITSPSAIVTDIWVTIFDETLGADARFYGERVAAYRPAGGAPAVAVLLGGSPTILFDDAVGEGMAWTISITLQTGQWGIFLTHAHPNPLKVGVTYRAGASLWSGQ